MEIKSEYSFLVFVFLEGHAKGGRGVLRKRNAETGNDVPFPPFAFWGVPPKGGRGSDSLFLVLLRISETNDILRIFLE